MKTKILILGAILAVALVGRANAQQPADGASTYAKNCASCHGARGTPNPATARALGIPNLAAAGVAETPDSVLHGVIENGKGRTMPAYKARLTAAQVAALVAYVRTFRRR